MSLIALRINAYEYFYNKGVNSITTIDYYYYDTEKGLLKAKNYNYRTGVWTYNINLTYNGIGKIANNKGQNKNYITRDVFLSYLRNDLKFLNDWYVQYPNMILNFFYNKDSFGLNGYKNYDNYKILYNDEGLAVASIYNGEWAGLYDNNSIKTSGQLYNKNGLAEYNNGVYVGGLNSVFGYNIADEFCKQVKQGFGLIGGLGVGLFITLLVISACVKYIKYKDGLYSNGIKEDKKLMRDIKTEANVLAFRTITGINADKTPDSVWTTYMKDDNELSPLDRERKRQYTDVMQRNYEKWKDKMQ